MVISPEVCSLLAYWRSLGGGHSIPDRTHLDLRSLTRILPWMFILEMSDDGALKYRLAGSALEAAVGRGMTGNLYSSNYVNVEYAAFMEELYAVSLVRGCGVFRSGSQSIDQSGWYDMEILALPFNDPRVMGGSVYVGMVRPFDYRNELFTNKWGTLEERIDQVIMVPSPLVVQLSNFSARVQIGFEKMNTGLRVLDTDKVLEIDGLGLHVKYPDIPSLPLVGDPLDGDGKLN